MRLANLALLTLVGSLCMSCAPDRTSVVIKQGNPQQFYISGCGTFDILTISGPDDAQRHDPNPYLKDYWVIQSNNDIDISRLPKPIVYGQVPPGFRQYTPANGPPPPILDGSTYGIKIGPRDGRCGVVNTWFVVRDGKITLVKDS